MPKNLNRLYQVYTLIAATIIFLSSLILLSGPVRTANLILITPLVALAWINFSNPAKTSESIWSLRMLIVVFCLTILGLITFRLPFIFPTPVANSEGKLATCPEPSPTTCPEFSQVEPLPSFPPIVGTVTITNPSHPLYQQTYPYIDFNDGSFLIILDATRSGWIKLEDVIPGLDNIKPGQLE